MMDVFVNTLLSIVLLLSILTSIIVQVIKPLFPKKFPSNLIVMIIAFVVTLVCGFIYASYCSIVIEAWMPLGLIGVAFMVAFAAMYGFDKLKEMLQQWVDGKNEEDHHNDVQ